VAVDTDVLGDAHAEAGFTELIGVPGSTSSLVSENAQVVTADGPPPEQEDATTQMGKYQAVALNGTPELGAVNVAVGVLASVELTSQNMNSSTVPILPGGTDGW
jgi:hypothetical protein